ncbi:Cochaperone protein [Lecanora helva]
MDQAARGASALSAKDFTSAVKHYTEAISQNPGAVDYYIKRSTAYTRLSPPNHGDAFKDAEIAVSLATKRGKRELIAQAQLRRAIALFGLERYGDAKQCLVWVKKLDEKERSSPIWEMKINNKLNELEVGDERAGIQVKEVPDLEAPSSTSTQSNEKPAESTTSTTESSIAPPTKSEVLQTPANKIRHDWMQSNDTVVVTLYCKGIPKEKTSVEFKSNALDVSFPLSTGSDFQWSIDPLHSSIDRMKSYYKIMSTKAEFTLIKSTPGKKWTDLEGTESMQTETAESQTASDAPVKEAVLNGRSINAGPAYPTSSKSGPKNWDKVASDLSKPTKKGENSSEDQVNELDDEEGDPTNSFFKMLFKNADPDTKRAMMKSYTESNGTALSTNWSEVSKGPVETSPPDGMEAKKWGS